MKTTHSNTNPPRFTIQGDIKDFEQAIRSLGTLSALISVMAAADYDDPRMPTDAPITALEAIHEILDRAFCTLSTLQMRVIKDE